jgi:hypothetical protein
MFVKNRGRAVSGGLPLKGGVSQIGPPISTLHPGRSCPRRQRGTPGAKAVAFMSSSARYGEGSAQLNHTRHDVEREERNPARGFASWLRFTKTSTRSASPLSPRLSLKFLAGGAGTG